MSTPGQPNSGPQAYSTQIASDGQGARTDGYQVVIDPSRLQSAIETFQDQLKGKSTTELITALVASVDVASFGDLPGAQHAVAELTTFVTDHATAMSQMVDGTLADFVARVLAAAQFGYDADPVTKAQAARTLAHAQRMEF